MTCGDFHDRILDLVSGRLDVSTARAMLEHVAMCRECEDVLALEEVLQTQKAAGAAEQVPEEWVTSMWSLVERQIAPRRQSLWRGPHVRRAFAAVAAVLVLVATFFLGRHAAGLGSSPVLEPSTTVESAVPFRTDSSRSELFAALDRLPDTFTLVSAAEASALLERSAPLKRWAQEVPIALDVADGVQVAELRRVLLVLPAESEAFLPTSLRPHEIRRWIERRV